MYRNIAGARKHKNTLTHIRLHPEAGFLFSATAFRSKHIKRGKTRIFSCRTLCVFFKCQQTIMWSAYVATMSVEFSLLSLDHFNIYALCVFFCPSLEPFAYLLKSFELFTLIMQTKCYELQLFRKQVLIHI